MTRLATILAAAGLLAVLASSHASGLTMSDVGVGTWTRLDTPAGEDVRYIEALQGENTLFWRTGTTTLRRATYTYSGGVVTLGSPAGPTGLTSGDHPSILNNGGGNVEGYFHHSSSPSVAYQLHATSTDGGLTWTDETQVAYPFPTPGVGGDSGTTGGGGIIEVGTERRVYAQNNFGDIVMYSTSAGAAAPLTSMGRLIAKGASGTAPSGATYTFENQSPSGDAYVLPTGDVLYFYTDGEGLESTQGAIGVLLLDSTGLGFTDVRDNFVHVSGVTGMTALDEMTVNNFSVSGNELTFLMFLDGKHGGSDRDIFYAPVTITFDSPLGGGVIPEPVTMAGLAAGLAALAGYTRRRR